MATLQQIPTAPNDAPPQTRQSIQAVINVLNRLTANGGIVTRQELVNSGSFVFGSGGSLVQSGTGKIVAIPLPIVGFATSGAFASILLSWNSITQAGFSHVEVWRSLTNDISTATLVGTTSAAIYSDTPPDSRISTTYYYWVRAVNTNGVAGAYNAVSGTAGSTANDPAYALEILTGKVTSSQLHQDLLTPINKIAPMSDTVAAQGVTQTNIMTGARLSADAVLANAVAAHDGMQAHFANKGNIATYSNTVTTVQTDLTSEVTARTQLEAKLDAATALYSTSSTAAADALTAIAGNTTAMQASIDQNTADINNSSGVVSTKVNAEAAQRNTLQAAIIGAADPATATLASLTSGMIHEERVARVSATSSINSTLTTIQGAVNVNGSINYAMNQAEQNANAYTNSVDASSKVTLRAEFNSIKASWDGADPSLMNYIHYGDIWFDVSNKPWRWSIPASGAVSGTITGATQANPVAITSASHGLTTGGRIQIESVAGMTELNLRQYIVTVVDANIYTLDGVDGTAYTAYSSGGIWEVGQWVAKQDNRFNTMAADITSEATVRATADTAQATKTDALSAGSTVSADAILANAVSHHQAQLTGFGNVAAIQTEQKTRIDSVQVQASRIDTLVAGFVSADGTLNTAINQAKTDAIATADSAAASRVATLQTSVNGNISTLQTTQTTLTTATQSNADALATLKAGFVSADGSINNAINQAKQSVLSTADTAAGQRDTNLLVTIGQDRAAAISANNTAILGTASSVFNYLTTNQYQTSTDVTNALNAYDPTGYAGFAGAVKGVQVTAPGGATSTVNNLVATMFGTDANGNPLNLATAVKTVQISDGSGGLASIEQKMTALRTDTGALQGEYTLKVVSGTKVAGIGLANNGTVSKFEVLADQFVIAPPLSAPTGTTALSPFIVDATKNMVLMDGASIIDATITNAHIASVAADKIAAGTITAAVSMTAAAINGGSINIGGVGGNFIVDNAGNTTLNSGTTGARMEIKNNVIKVIDANNVVRVQLGNLLV